MATSGVTAWELTARDIIAAALVDELGAYGMNEDVPADAEQFALNQLNALIKSNVDAAHLESEGTVTIPANSASGTIASNVSEVISARIVSASYERPLVRFGRDEYFVLPNKAAVGEPTCFYVSNQRGSVEMYVWPVPSAETTIKVDYRRIPETITGASETVDFPDQYLPALIAKLATRCAGRLGIAPGERQELFVRAESLWREMQDNERPASYMLGPY